MTQITSHPILKLSTSIFAGIALGSTAAMLLSMIVPGFNYNNIITGQFLVIIVAAITIYAAWQWREKKSPVPLNRFTGFLQGIIRWWLAYEISTYGFAKILQTQFETVPYRYDMVAGELSGFSLTWFYFGYSYSLAVIIGSIQVIGSVLLLFRRTTLLGIVMLLPVMVNIVLINAFYNISTGAFINSIFYTTALFYFLLLDVSLLNQTLQRYKSLVWQVPIKSTVAKNLVRLSPIIIAFFGLLSLVLLDKSDSVLYGAYTVEEFVRNGTTQLKHAWVNDSTIFSRIYFSGPQGCAFSPNPFRYKPSESLRGDYTYDEDSNNLNIVFYYGPNESIVDSVTFNVSQRTEDHLSLYGIMNGDSLKMSLRKTR